MKPGGYISVSEATWFSPKRPAIVHKFWMDAYPQIDTISNKVAIMERAGYIPAATFIIPENCWTDHFYTPQAKAQELFLKKYPRNKIARALVDNQRYEAALYNRYKEYYGYVFYIGKKI